MNTESDELIIPVYLNQRIVFDLIAMLQDGMSTVTRVSSSEESKSVDNQRYGTSFGLGQALSSLLKIDVSGDRSKVKEGTAGMQRSEERVHSPSSLFQKLRATLKSKSKLKVADGNYIPDPGDLVEFSASLRRNPIIQAMETFMGVMDMASLFGTQQKGGKRPVPDDSKRVRGQMEKFTESLRDGKTADIISDPLGWKYRAVITVEEEYLNDPTMSDLIDGQFKVVGKVIRVIHDTNGSVSLLRKVTIGAMNKQMLEEAFSHLSSEEISEAIAIPKIELEIQGPVVQIIPVAIFA